ncbi:MAG: Zn-dependent hydrolase [Anaerolineae bacterium]|jgi:N-carbamoyl-L-amino-acid hydrolase
MKDLFKQIPNLDRLEADINALASHTDPDQPWTRRPFTKLFREGRAWLSREMEAAGLTVELDASGNVVGRRPGTEELPPIVIGSHTDTVSGGGRFDGVIGVVGGLEIARCLQELDIQLRHPLEVVDFLGEEPTDFGVSTVGSRGMTGNLSPELLAKTNEDGQTLELALIELGGRPADIPSEVRKPGDIAAYLEIHIEQGPVLEQKGIPLAAVTGIAGIRRFFVVVSGEINHAGTTPMALRKDGLIAASQFIVDAEKIIRQEENAVGTVGYLSVSPNMANVVPGRAELIVEMRSIDPEIIERIGENLKRRAAEIAEERGIPIWTELLTDAHPVQADPRLIEITTEACRETAPDALVLPSGAGHDATQIATIAPIGMIFVPSRDGKSHCPEEWTDLEDVALGVQALARALLKIDEAF